MAALSFAIQKAAFMTSWSALVKNYMTRKSDDKLDSLEKDVLLMLRTVTSLKQQSNVTKNAKRKKKDNETSAAVSQQSLPSHQDVLSLSQSQEQQEPCAGSQDVAQDVLSQSWALAGGDAGEKWKNDALALDAIDNWLFEIKNGP